MARMDFKTQIAADLLTWYGKHKRDLPWRQTDDPYRILLSEFMLQQTQVDTVIPYYHRFLDRFPTVYDLANAAGDDVLKAWEGLGYYARARNLHKAARSIAMDFGGTVPDTYDELKSLPGFGPYTTAAVLSIAYDRDYAVLDGNVIRVLTRLFDIGDDVAQTRAKNRLWDLAQDLLPKGEAATYNQAIMELGALICTAKTPVCDQCPVQEYCAAYRAGNPQRLPVKAKRKPRPHHTLCAGIVWHNDKVLITQRPQNGLLGGLWEFPAGTQQGGESLQDTCMRGIRETAGIDVKIDDRYRTVKHAFTHFSITLHAFQCHYVKGRARPLNCDNLAWIGRADFSAYAFSRTSRRLIDYLQQDEPDLFAFEHNFREAL